MRSSYSSLQKIVFCALAFLAALTCVCCASPGAAPVSGAPEATATALPTFSDVDFATSPYKHINNGGVTTDETMPYNIDAITGATLTVEGPGVEVSIPLSVREMENRSDGLFRGLYEDASGAFVYEGLDLYYLLYDMIEGDNGIILTDSAYEVQLKNSSRAPIASFTLAEVTAAHENGRPILLACGMGTPDESVVAPFVFDAANPNERSAGYVEALDNDDGCLRLVFDLGSYGNNPDYKAFANVAYVYVQEAEEPGFKHTASKNPAYAASRYCDALVSFRGAALGCEMDFTVSQLESLVSYDETGALVTGGVGYSDFYSLANTTYWYVNEYEGLDLYKLLLYLGMDDAEAMGLAAARTTLVQFVASDGVLSKESFSVDTLSYPDAFGFYNKNAADMGDGGYAPTNADLVRTGYPVLLAYGVNRYPYTITSGDNGYLSGLSNSGGPIRVVFGKTQYNHANGSNQVQYLSQVIVGDDVLYNTHAYTDNAAQNALSAQTLSFTVHGEDGQTLAESSMTVADVENIVYAPNVEGSVRKAALIKDLYEADFGAGYETDVYEGIGLQYFLMDVLGLPGTNGTVTFEGDGQTLTVRLDSLFAEGWNATLGRNGIAPILAFAKNGAPLVQSAASEGYVERIALHPALATEAADYEVNNAGGPLMLLLPSSSADTSDARSLMNISSITVDLVPDAYAHIRAPYDTLSGTEVRFYGEGLEQEASYTVSDLESRQKRVRTLDYSVLDESGKLTERRFRGMALYDLFTEIGLANNAGDVTVYATDGTTATFSLSLLKRQSYVNSVSPDKQALCAMLAYGTGDVTSDPTSGIPLVINESDPGFDAALENAGGPLLLVVPQESPESVNGPLFVKQVTAIEVSANDIDTWSHRMSDIYGEFLDAEFELVVKNDDSEWSHRFTVAQLESMEDLIVRDTYSVLTLGECEGVDLWKLFRRYAGNVPGADNPVSITVYAVDGYKNDLLSVFYKEGFELGVPNEAGERKKLILAYAVNGCPLVDSESHEGYTGLAGNSAGPLRVVAETNQGASVKYAAKLVVTVPGVGALDSYINTEALSALQQENDG